jgi:hypothetical protein
MKPQTPLMSTRYPLGGLLLALLLAPALMASCSSDDDVPFSGPSASPGPVEESEEGLKLVKAIQARFSSRVASSNQEPRATPILASSQAERIEYEGSRLRPRLPDKAMWGVRYPARVTWPERASGGFVVRDATSGMDVTVSMAGASEAPAEVAAGFVVYRRGHSSGADIVHRPTAEGTEDFVRFERAPDGEEIEYSIGLGEGVAGLRLVANTVELLDAGGTPRLRMAPPYLVDAEGAFHWARVDVEGCAVDRDPRGPWGRAVVPPGTRECRVRVAWDGMALRYPALLDPLWITTGNLIWERSGHTAALLQDGRVMVMGGAAVANSVELFDPSTNTWSVGPSMESWRTGHVSGTLSNGDVLVAGGIGPQGAAERYDVQQEAWIPAGFLTLDRDNPGACALANNGFLVVGGRTGQDVPVASAEVYNPATNQWSVVAPMTAGARSHTTASLLNDGRVLVAGGLGEGAQQMLDTAQVYDPVTNQWSDAAPLNVGRFSHTATVLPNNNGTVLVVGGQGGGVALTSAEIYDPVANLWIPAASMAQLRQDHTASLVLSSNQVVVVGGRLPVGVNALSSSEMYDIGTNTWVSLGNLLFPRRGHTATTLQNGRVLVAGGEGDAGSFGELLRGLLGEACDHPNQCISGYCVDGVCCESACGGGSYDFLACSVAGGASEDGECQIIPGVPGAPCTSPGQCSSGYCVDGVCCGDDCGGGKLDCRTCAGVGGVSEPGFCHTILDHCYMAGVECATPFDCDSGYCVDGVCCDSACGGDDDGGGAAAKEGDCQACSVQAGAKENGTCATNVCNQGQQCQAATDCSTGFCVDGVCCDTVCGGGQPDDCQACSVQAGASVDGMCATRASCQNGQPCAEPNDCGSGYCVDGVCCDGPCGGGIEDCQACSSAKGASKNGECSIISKNPLACPDPPDPCQEAICNPNSGDCMTVPRADAPACQTSNLKPGERCGSNEHCESGFCVDNVCCTSPCDDACKSCANPKSPGTCMAERGVDLRHDCASGQSCVATCSDPALGESECIGAFKGSQCAPAHCSKDGTQSFAPSTCPEPGAPCPEQTASSCGPYLCNQATGVCRENCSSIDDCAPGYACNSLSYVCGPPAPSAFGVDPTCSFSAPSPSGSSTRSAILLALAALSLARRSRARSTKSHTLP